MIKTNAAEALLGMLEEAGLSEAFNAMCEVSKTEDYVAFADHIEAAILKDTSLEEAIKCGGVWK